MDGGSLSDTQRTMVLPLLQETNIRGRPYVTVSSKGIKNNLSRYPNDGADFGPDTTLGATALGEYGSPYTETAGIQEAETYRKANSGVLRFINSGTPFTLDNQVIIPDSVGLEWSMSGSTIQPSSTFPSGKDIIATNYATNSTGKGLYFAYIHDFQLANPHSITVNSYFNLKGLEDSHGIFVHRVYAPETITGTYTLILDGNEDSILEEFRGFVSGSSSSTCPPISWLINAGAATALNSVLPTMVIDAVSFYWYNSVFVPSVNNSYSSNVQMSAGSGASYLSFRNCWFADGSVIDLNATTVHNIEFIGCQSYNVTEILKNGNVNNTLTINKWSVISGTGLTIASSTSTVKAWYVDIKEVDTNSSTNGITSNLTYFSPLVGDNAAFMGGTIWKLVVTPALTTNPPVSGTAYQNTNPYDIRLKIPVTYNPTATAAATLATGISSTSTVTTTTKVSIPAGLTAADGQILTYDMVVPAGWYFKPVATNATIGTVEVEAA